MDGTLNLPQLSSPPTAPASGRARMYVDADGIVRARTATADVPAALIKDGVTGTLYKIVVNSGVIGIEAI